ncbi:MAG: hypothetical protein M3O55_02400, partial [Actinomycetota bacterium]|nr:hypothetical protein [Actinomycetota bacterium]
WCIAHGTPVATVTPRRSPLRDLPDVLGCFTLSGAGDLTALLAQVIGPLVVFADDAGTLLDTEMEAVLTDLLQRADGRPWALVLAGVTDELITTYRGITTAARRNKAGLLISPSGPVDGEVLGVRLPRGVGARVGRGVVAVRGATTPVQVAF